jgi:hypothetical protein
MADSIKKDLRIIAFKGDEGWVAHCVEYDICAQGHDLATVKRNMAATLIAECEYTEKEFGEPFKGIDSAPEYLALAFEDAEEASLESDFNFRIAA